jgi:hypothetical protein
VKPIPETAVSPDKFTSNLSSSSLCAAIAFMIQFGVQREGAAHVRDRLTLRLPSSQHTAATADYLMVFTATACRSAPRSADAFWISRHISKAPRFDVIVHFAQSSVNLPVGYHASSARPTRHRSNRGTKRRAERTLFERELFDWSVDLGHARGQ